MLNLYWDLNPFSIRTRNETSVPREMMSDTSSTKFHGSVKKSVRKDKKALNGRCIRRAFKCMHRICQHRSMMWYKSKSA